MHSNNITILQSRRKTRMLMVGKVAVGSDAPVSIQSMCSTDTRDAMATLEQIRALAQAGCEIARVAVPDREAIESLTAICASSPLPVVADIHFDFHLALAALGSGIAGLRYNPGNIGNQARVEELAQAAAHRHIPIRIGVNAGSLGTKLLRKYGSATPEALVESALSHAAILEEVGFSDIKLSLKASDVPTTIAAYRLCAARCDYPLHLGVTEAGTLIPGTIKSALALGILLAEGIGDTIRVSLSADPVEEVWVAKQLLRNLGLRRGGLELVSCPRCGRCTVDVYGMAERVERQLRHLETPVQVAIMGCEVNGPGEAKAADIGIAGAAGEWILFEKGAKRQRLSTTEAEKVIVQEALRLAQNLI